MERTCNERIEELREAIQDFGALAADCAMDDLWLMLDKPVAELPPPGPDNRKALRNASRRKINEMLDRLKDD